MTYQIKNIRTNRVLRDAITGKIFSYTDRELATKIAMGRTRQFANKGARFIVIAAA